MMTFPNVIFQSVLMYCLHSGCVCRAKFEDCILSYPPKLVFALMFNELSLFCRRLNAIPRAAVARHVALVVTSGAMPPRRGPGLTGPPVSGHAVTTESISPPSRVSAGH